MSYLKRIKEKLAKRKGAYEECDSKPMAIPVGFRKPITLEDRMQRLLNADELRRWAMQSGHDTPEEFDDFGDDDGPDDLPATAYEMVTNPSTGREMTRAESEAFESQMVPVDRYLARRKMAARQKRAAAKKDAASKGFKEEDPTK